MYAIRSYYDRAQGDAAALPDHQRRTRLVAEKQRQVTGKQLGPHVEGERGVGLAVDAQEDVSRITSYNVCYTKLLRARAAAGGTAR